MPMIATTIKRKVTFGSCTRIDIMIVLHWVIQRAQVFVSNSIALTAMYFSGVPVLLEFPLLALSRGIPQRGAGAHREIRVIPSLDRSGNPLDRITYVTPCESISSTSVLCGFPPQIIWKQCSR